MPFNIGSTREYLKGHQDEQIHLILFFLMALKSLTFQGSLWKIANETRQSHASLFYTKKWYILLFIVGSYLTQSFTCLWCPLSSFISCFIILFRCNHQWQLDIHFQFLNVIIEKLPISPPSYICSLNLIIFPFPC